jgi:hypothetical protein
LAGLDESTRAGIAGELNTAGITDDAGTVRRQWLQVLGQAATAPIRVSLVSRSGGLSTHCRVDLFEGRGIAVGFSRPVASAADGAHESSGALAAYRNDPSTQAFITSEPGEVRSTTSGIGRKE